MNTYTVYEVSTGNIISSGSSSDNFEVIESKLPQGQAILRNETPINEYYKVQDGQLVANPLSVEERNIKTANENRIKRNLLLKDSDWTQIPDCTVDQTAWATYRQALRDITDNPYWPNLYDEHWPTQPE